MLHCRAGPERRLAAGAQAHNVQVKSMAKNKEIKSPGVIEVLIGMGLSMMLGALLAVAHLVFRPVEVVRGLPKEPADGVRYQIEGASSSSAKGRWVGKVKSIRDKVSGEVLLNESDMNAWSGATFQQAEVPVDKPPSFALVSGVPNFRVDGDKLQVGSVNDLYIYGGIAKLVVGVKGGFVKSAGGWEYKVSEFYVGGFPVHKVPMISAPVLARLMVAAGEQQEISAVLDQASVLKVSNGSLVVRMP